VPLAALVLQAWLPRVAGRYAWFDLPLVVTVYFALGRRSPIQGTLMGAAMGLFEDALTPRDWREWHRENGGRFLAASVGIRIDVENHTIRLLLSFLLSLLSSVIVVFVSHFLLGLDLEWNWYTMLYTAIVNAVIALFLFPLLDRLQVRNKGQRNLD